MTDSAPASSPLSGIRIVDFSRYLPGPACTLHLAWLGAEVVCVEQPPHGDPMRAIPPLDDEGHGLAYRSLRRSARCVLIDLSTSDGQAEAQQLVADADVVVESFRPGVAERLGIGPIALRATHPELIYCSISGYGQDGPWSQAPGHDLGYEAAVGLLERSGTSDVVTNPAVPLADFAGALTASTAICAALVGRARTGQGCHLDIALSESALALQAMDLPAANRPESVRGAGTLTGALACYSAYRCSDDEWVAVAPIEPKFFQTLCSQLDLPELSDIQFDPAAQDRIRAALAARFAERSAREWEELLAGEDGGNACVVRARTMREVSDHPQISARGAVDVSTLGPAFPLPASPYVIDGIRSAGAQSSPAGQS